MMKLKVKFKKESSQMFPMALLLSSALAGERVFAFSYGYGTLPKGGVEVEHYLTAYGKQGGDTYYWEHQIELEYGITDHLESGLYIVGAQWDDGPFSFRKYKGRLRYRFGSEGVGLVDPGVYLEYIGVPGFDEHAIEAKLLLAKHVGLVETALNLEYVVEIGDDAVVHELEPTLGVGVHVAPWFVLSAESKFEMYLRESGNEGPYVFVGPSMHIAGEGGKLWWTLAGILPVTSGTQKDEGPQIRSLIAVNL